jgi:hypothetical protein
MEHIENCEMIKAEIVNGTRLEMKFYDKENDVLRTVKFNLQSYDREKGQFVDDPEKAQRCEEWSQKYFGCSFNEVPEQVGVSRDIYVYENFCSLWESEEQQRAKKFDTAVKGIIKTKIENIYLDNIGIHVEYKYQDELYESKYTTAEFIKDMKKWVRDPEREARAFRRFKEIFGKDISEKDSLIGAEIQVQVKKAFSSYYGEILPL